MFQPWIKYSRLCLSCAMLLLLGILLSERISFAEPMPTPVEVFDVKQEKVTHVIPLTEALQETIVNALNQSPRPYGGITMNPKAGIVVHLRYPEPVTLGNAIYPQPVSEVYLFLEAKTEPLALLFFSKGHKPRVYTLQADPKRLIQAVQPKT